MALLEVSNVTRRFGDGFALKNVSLSAERGDIVCLLGPSGCGKTTLLRLIAGLETPDDGTVAFDGRVLNDVPSRNRGFGLMFQDLALFPHMDVSGNVSFGMRMQRRPQDQVTLRVNALLRLVGLENFQKRKVHELSGGERQRVALARSLAAEPSLLMLDEPLGALDRALRETLQTQVRGILKALGQTAIYVTHDRDEAYAMADSMVIMEEGEVVQAGTPEELYTAPRSERGGAIDGHPQRTLGETGGAGRRRADAREHGRGPALWRAAGRRTRGPPGTPSSSSTSGASRWGRGRRRAGTRATSAWWTARWRAAASNRASWSCWCGPASPG